MGVRERYEAKNKTTKTTGVKERYEKRKRKSQLETTIGFDTLESDLKSMGETVYKIGNEWQTQETMKNTRSVVESMYHRLTSYQDYQKQYGGVDLTDLTNSYKSALEGWDDRAKLYGGFKNADAYNVQKKQWDLSDKFRVKTGTNEKGEDEYRGFTYDEVQEELKKYAPDSDEYKFLSNYTGYTDLNDFEKALANTQEYEYPDLEYPEWYSYVKKNYDNWVIPNAGSLNKDATLKRGSQVNYTIHDVEKSKQDREDYFKEFSGGKTLAEFERQFEVDKNKKTSLYTELETQKNLLELKNGVYDDYKYVESNADFEETSQYVPSSDPVYEYINGDAAKRSEMLREHYSPKMDIFGNANEKDFIPQSIYEKYSLDELEEREIRVYNSLKHEDKLNGTNKATEFLEGMQTALNKRATDKMASEIQKEVDNSVGASIGYSVLSIPMNIAGAISSAGDYLAGNTNPYSTNKIASNMASTIRSEVGANIEEGTKGFELFGQNIPAFLYQTAMSMGDTALGGYALGPAYSVIAGSSAFQQRHRELIESGVNENEALTGAFASGAAEVIFEYISLDKLLKINGVDGIKKGIKAAAKQAGIEASEEFCTELANIIADEKIRGESSELNQFRKDLKERGYTESEINTEVAKKIGGQLGWAAASGFASGGGMGAGASLYSYLGNRSIGKGIQSKNQASDMFDIAKLTPSESDAYNLYTEYANKGVTADNITNAQLGNLYSTIDADAQSTLKSKKSTLEQKRAATETLKKLSAVDEKNTVSKDTINAIDQNISVREGYMESANELIAEGLESGKDTKSYKLATEYKQKLDKGEQLTEKEIANLVKANSEAISNEDISLLSEDDAALFKSIYDGKTNKEDFLNSFNLVTGYAKNNFSPDYILEHKGVLTEKQVAEIYKAKVLNSDKSLENAIANLKEKHEGTPFIEGTFNDSVINYENTKVDGKVNWNSLKPSQKRAIAILGQVGKGMGMDVELISDGLERGINGAFEISGNKMLIDIYAGMDKIDGSKLKDTIIPTTSHEMTHWMQNKSPEIYRKYDQYVFDTLKMSGLTEHEILESRRKKMEAAHPNATYTDAEVRDEVIARASEDMFAKSEEIKKFLNTLTDSEKKSFVEKVKEILQNVKEWLNDFLSKQKSTSDEAKIIRQYADRIDGQIELWDKMLISSISANQALKKEGITGEKLAKKVTSKVSNEGDMQFAERDNGEMSNEDYSKLLSKKAINVSKAIKAKISQQRISRYANMAEEQIPIVDIFRVADYNKVNIAYKYTVRNDGKDYFTVIRKQQIKPDSVPHNLNKIIQEEIENARADKRVSQSRNGRDNNSLGNNVLRDGEKLQKNDTLVKRSKQSDQERYNAQGISNIGRGVKNSDRDTLGNTLTEAQQSYFAESKVRDENGNLKVMYHGTPNATFTKFRSGTYFTEHKWYADNYQNQGASSLSYKKTADNPDTYAVYLDIKKPFDTRNKKERDIFYNEYYQQWGTGTDLMESGLPDWLDGGDLQEFLEEQGYDYDGLILDEGGMGGYGEEVINRGLSYVVFSPEQVKSVENKTPTNDPDYRFSMRENVEETKELIAVHNLSEEKLLKSLQLGGLPMPSIAIIKARDGHNTFGNISLVFNKETIDPQFMRANKVYSGDAWTPTYPRIEHKVNDKAQKKIANRINNLVPEEVIRGLGGLHIDSYNLEQDLNRHNGNLVEMFRYNTALKYAFLTENGVQLELPNKFKPLGRYSNRDKDAIIRVAENVSEEKLRGITGGYTNEQIYEVEPEIRKAVNGYLQEKYKKLPEKALAKLISEDTMSVGQVFDLAIDALNYLTDGIKQEVDYYASRDLIDETIDAQKYETWIKELFADIVEKEGIRNNKDMFTPSGNRRSFEALHYEHNLENVIKAMKEDGTKGIGSFGRGNIFGASTTEYGSIAEIKEDAQNRMKQIPEEKYEEIRKGFSERFFELAYSLPIHKDSFTATDSASTMLVEAVAKFKTKSGMANYLRNESKGWANYSDYVVDDLVELVNDIRNMPVSYFEAKPQRAVGFNEVATAIIPDNSSDELKSKLTDNGVKFVEYENGNEESRLNVLNSLENVKFSDRDNYAPTFYSQMGKTIDAMKQDKIGANSVVSYLKGRGVKNEEIKWSGIETFLEGKKSVTKAELQEFVAGSMLQIEESTYDGVGIEVLSEDGDNYIVRNKETKETLDEWEWAEDVEDGMEGYVSKHGDIALSVDEIEEIATQDWNSTRWSDLKIRGGTNYRELTFKLPNTYYSNYAMRTHWGEDAYGILAHARIQDFETDNDKMLFIEEIQSDWHNEGHKRGYFKKLSKEEVEKVGSILKKQESLMEQAKEKYRAGDIDGAMVLFEKEQNLFKERREIEGTKEGVPDAPFKNNYYEFVLKKLIRMAAEQGYDTIGWTPANLQSARWSDEYAEAYRIEYDQDIPKFLNKYGKKWGAKVGTTTLNNGAEVWSMDITDSMKNSVLYEGQVMYSDRDKAYMDAVNNGDMETAQRLVDEAAKNAGYTVKGYHGTYNFGRTVFGEYNVLYLTDEEYVAKNFSGAQGKRKLTRGEVDAFNSPIEDVVEYVANNTGWGDIREATTADIDKTIERYSHNKERVKRYLEAKELIFKGDKLFTGTNVGSSNFPPNSQLADESCVRRIAMESIARKGQRGGTYELWADIGNTVVVEGNGNYYFKLRVPEELLEYAIGEEKTTKIATTDQITRMALEAGYDSVTFKDIIEGGDYGNAGISTVYAVFNPTQNVKSADPVTYDDNGNVIPLSERFNAENEDIRYSDRDYVETNSKAVMTNNRIDYLIEDSGAGKRVDYANYWITSINPTDFLNMTLTKYLQDRSEFDKYPSEWNENSTVDTYDYIGELKNNMRETPYLAIDITTGQVVGHEGRHRMRALEKKGITSAEIRIEFRDEDGRIVKYSPDGKRLQIKDVLKIKNQYNTNQSSTIENIIPLNEDYREKIFANYGENNSQAKDVLYSDRDNVSLYDLMGENDKLIKENEQLKEDVERLKERLKIERQVTNGNYFNANQLDAVAGHIRNIAHSNYNKKDLVTLLNGIYQYIAHSPDLNWQDLYAQCYDVASMVLSESRPITETNEYCKRMLKDIRNTKVSVNEKQVQEAKHTFGNRWRNVFFNKIKFVEYGTSLDSQWQEWAAIYPDVFDKNVTDADMLVKLYDILDGVREGSEMIVEYDTEEETRQLAREIYNQYWNVSPIRTTADKYDKQIKRLNFEHRKAMKEFRDSYDEKLKNQHKVDKEKAQELIKKIRERKDKEIAEVKQRSKERMDAYKENAERKTKIQSITSNALTLNKWLTKNSKEYHIHEALKGPVIKLLQSIDFSSKKMLEQNIPTKKDITFRAAFKDIQKMLDDAQSGNVELVELYGHDLAENMQMLVDAADNIVGDNHYVINQMSLEELQSLERVVKYIKQVVTQFNEFHTVHHKEGIAHLSQENIAHLDSLGEGKEHGGMLGKLSKLFKWDNATPYHAFNRLGKAGVKVFEALQDGWDALAKNVKVITDFVKETYTSKEVKSWGKETKTFAILQPDGTKRTFKMTIAQMMAFHCVSKQPDAMRHLLSSGMTLASFEENGKVVKDKKNILLTKSDIDMIRNSLTARQREVADGLQGFMNTTCSNWGNEVSLRRFGIKMFGLPDYFPIKVSPAAITKEEPNGVEDTSLFRLLNMSFTKSRNEFAAQSIEIGNIFDIFAQHTSDMAKYNALALPVLDAYRWYSFKGKTFEGNEYSVYASMQTALGEDSVRYFNTFLKDINGSSNVSRDNLGGDFFRNAKIAAVAFNIRTILLQPTSYLRASAVINNRYLAQAFFFKPKIEKSEKYCGMALWKSLGYYDVNISKGLTSIIKHDETTKDKVIEFSMKGMEIADKVTIGYLWNACELEIRKTRKDLKVGSEEFYETIGKRLREVIYTTQVVDSTMTRSQIMRSSDGRDKMLTAFMSEPTLSYNMLQDALYTASLEKRANGKSSKESRKKIARVITSYIVTNAVCALVESGFDAFRDDDEEEMDIAEFMKLYLTNFTSDLSIIGKIPYIKEIITAIEGYSSSRSDTQWMTSLVNAGKAWGKIISGDGEGQGHKAIKNTIRAFSDFTGLAVYNAYRDFMAALNKLDIFTAEELEEMLDEIFS